MKLYGLLTFASRWKSIPYLIFLIRDYNLKLNFSQMYDNINLADDLWYSYNKTIPFE